MHQHSAQRRARSALLAWLVAAALVPVMIMTAVTLAGWMQPASRTTADGGHEGPDGEAAAMTQVTSATRPAPAGTDDPTPSGQRRTPGSTVSRLAQDPASSPRPGMTASTESSMSPTSAQSAAPRPWAPTPPRSGTVPAGGYSTPSSQVAQILERVNTERRAKGCQPLELDTRLMTVSQSHAKDMAARDFFDHTSPDGTSPGDRATTSGFPHGIGENLAAGYSAVETVMAGWMNSPGHRANILNCTYTVTGIGYDPGSVGTAWGPGSWVQVFGTL